MKKPAAKQPIDDVVQSRLDCLEWLIDTDYEGKPSVFEKQTEISMTQVNQWFTGYRALRDKALRRLEEKTNKPQGWFDQRHASATLTAPSFQVSASGGPSTDPLDLLTAALLNADESTRRALSGLMAQYIQDPIAHAALKPAIRLLLIPAREPPKSKQA